MSCSRIAFSAQTTTINQIRQYTNTNHTQIHRRSAASDYRCAITRASIHHRMVAASSNRKIYMPALVSRPKVARSSAQPLLAPKPIILLACCHMRRQLTYPHVAFVYLLIVGASTHTVATPCSTFICRSNLC